jgi:hypothetical protein
MRVITFAPILKISIKLGNLAFLGFVSFHHSFAMNCLQMFKLAIEAVLPANPLATVRLLGIAH